MKARAAVVLAGAALMLGPAAASAAPAPPPILILEPPIVAPGGLFTATLDNYCNPDNEERQLLFEVESGRQSFVSCRDDGLAIATLQAPRRIGQFYVLVDTLNGDTTATIEVQAGLGGPDEPLPDTGPGHPGAVLAAGGVLLAAGLVLVRTARMRRPGTRSASA